MSYKRPSIPEANGIGDVLLKSILDALKENAEITMGRRGAKVAKLGPTSSLATVINKVNELIDKLQT